MKNRMVGLLLALTLVIGLTMVLPIEVSAATVTTTDVLDMVNFANKQDGKTASQLGIPTSGWCGYFIGYCINNSGIARSLGTISNDECNWAMSPVGWVCTTKNAGTLYCFSSAHANRLREMYTFADGQLVETNAASFSPQVGDIVEFTWSSWENHAFDHTGIVTSVDGNYITYIDGNSSSGNGKVATHTMEKTNSYIYGFLRFNTNETNNDSTISITSGIYYIEAYCGKVVEVENSGQRNGANVQIWENAGIDCQKFKIEKNGNYYTLTASHSGKVIDIANGSSQSGTNIQQYTYNGSDAQKWQFIDAGDGYYYIQSALGTYMDVYYENTSNGTNVWAYSFNGSNAQKFKLVSENGVVARTAPINTQTYNGHTYELYDYSLTWENAKQFCEDKGGHLVTITSQNEQNFINSFLTGSKNLYYIGLQKVSGNWNWVTGESFSYTNWTVNEPSNNNEPYVQLYANYYKDHQIGSWNDTVNGGSTSVEYYALSNIGFICEYEPQEQYYLDVNGVLDDVKADNVVEYGTFDVYINGALVADDVSDYYIAWPTGTTYEIKDIRTTTGHNYNGVSSGSLKGAIGTNDIAVELIFSTLTPMSIKSVEVSGSTITVNWTPSSDSRVTKYEIYVIKNYSGDLKPKGDFSFSTQSFWEAGVTETSHSFDNISDGAYPILIQAVGNGIIVEQLFSETVVVHATPIVHFMKTERYTQGQFSDVPANQWFTSNVADAFELGLMKGNSTSTFNPYGDVTVAEAITMAARIHSIYTAGIENIEKASGNIWYQPYLNYAYENGIITTAFYNSDVTQKATRAQFAEIFANALPDEGLSIINSITDNSIPDVSISEAYAQYVYKLYRAGILIGGDANGTFSPLTYITRAEAAAIVSRMADTDKRVSFRL